MSDTSTIDEPERKIKLQEFHFQRRFLFGCTIGLLIGTILWIIAMSTNRWFIVTGGQGREIKSAAVSHIVALIYRLFFTGKLFFKAFITSGIKLTAHPDKNKTFASNNSPTHGLLSLCTP